MVTASVMATETLWATATATARERAPAQGRVRVQAQAQAQEPGRVQARVQEPARVSAMAGEWATAPGLRAARGSGWARELGWGWVRARAPDSVQERRTTRETEQVPETARARV